MESYRFSKQRCAAQKDVGYASQEQNASIASQLQRRLIEDGVDQHDIE